MWLLIAIYLTRTVILSSTGLRPSLACGNLPVTNDQLLSAH